MKKNLHRHSLEAYASGRLNLFSERSRQILALLETQGARTDRAIMTALGFTDPNTVRPRISEMIDSGVLMETGTVRDPDTGKSVRVVDLVSKSAQLSLL